MFVNKTLLLGAICIGLLLSPSVAQPSVVHDTFFVTLNPDNTVDQPSSGGSGFDGGTFFVYSDPAGGPNWWNQWFFNSPEILGSKTIEWQIGFEGVPDTEPPTVVEVAINYSSRDWLDPSTPPMPGDDPFIIRESIFIGSPGPGQVINNFGNPLLIRDFNPIWVSIDLRLLESSGFDAVLVGGEIWHEHHPIPEPTSLIVWSLLGAIGIAVGWRRKRRV